MSSPWRRHDGNEINYYIDQLLSSRKYNPNYYQNKLIDDELDSYENDEMDD
ncbi:MAG: hypothetical protein ACOWWR_15580 [Eubacteriales bacterium]